MKKQLAALVASVTVAASILTPFGTLAESGAESAAVSGAESAENSANYGKVVIQDGDDHTITFTSMPKGVILGYSGEAFMKLGLKDKVVATSQNNAGRQSPIDGVADDFKGIPELERSHENAVASGADLIIGEISAFQDDRWGTYDTLEKDGINGYAVNGTVVSDETMDSIYTDIENYGKIFKVEDKAKKLIEETKAEVKKTTDKVKDVADDKKVKAFVMDSLSENEIYTTSAGLESDLIELAGGINTTKGMSDKRWFTTSVETLVTANPDYIIFNDYGNDTVQSNIDFIKNNAALADVPAVKNQNFIVVPLAYVMHDLSATVALDQFAKAFYPDLAS